MWGAMAKVPPAGSRRVLDSIRSPSFTLLENQSNEKIFIFSYFCVQWAGLPPFSWDEKPEMFTSSVIGGRLMDAAFEPWVSLGTRNSFKVSQHSIGMCWYIHVASFGTQNS